MHLLKYFDKLSLRPENAKALKGLILDLAIRGRLTEEWRKENKVKIGTTLENNFLGSGFEDLFELPPNWRWKKLSEISKINGGYAFKSANYVENGVRVIRISDFDEKGFKNDKIKRYVFSSELTNYELEENNILMAMTGGTVGKSYFVNELHERMFVNQRVATIKIEKPTFEDFINYVIQSRLIQNIIEAAKNSTNDNISMRDIKGFNIPLPPLPEQKAIVQVVNQLMAEVDQLEAQAQSRLQLRQDFVRASLRQLTTTDSISAWQALQPHFSTFFENPASIDQLKAAILQLAVQGKLTAHWRQQHPEVEPASELLARIKAEKARLIAEKKIRKEKPLPEIGEEEVPFGLPEGWVWCRMGEVIKDLRYGTSKKCDYGLGKNPVLRIPNLVNGKISFSDLKSTNLTEKETNDLAINNGDLILIRSNGSVKLVGKSVPVLNIDKGYSFAGYLIRLRLFNLNFDNKYLHLVLESPFSRRSIELPIRTTSGVKNINTTEISSLLIPVCSKLEQKAIVQIVNQLMDFCDQLKGEVKRQEGLSGEFLQAAVREVMEGAS